MFAGIVYFFSFMYNVLNLEKAIKFVFNIKVTIRKSKHEYTGCLPWPWQ